LRNEKSFIDPSKKHPSYAIFDLETDTPVGGKDSKNEAKKAFFEGHAVIGGRVKRKKGLAEAGTAKAR
jgi:hypothetical protein